MSTYETAMSGIRILPGCWRPHYPWEQIAWISPPWPSQDYLWYDFPEAIFTDIGLLYLSAVNPAFPVVFPDLPEVPWRVTGQGIAFERDLPNGISFGGSLTKASDQIVAAELHISNGTDGPLDSVKLQTCIFLRAIKEFSAYTANNKFVHLPSHGWLPFPRAREITSGDGRYRLGWRAGPTALDLPLMATVSSQGQRLVATTWYEDTYSMVSNPAHPCMHADPAFPRIDPGEARSIAGEVIFFEGDLEAFGDWFADRMDRRRDKRLP